MIDPFLGDDPSILNGSNGQSPRVMGGYNHGFLVIFGMIRREKLEDSPPFPAAEKPNLWKFPAVSF